MLGEHPAANADAEAMLGERPAANADAEAMLGERPVVNADAALTLGEHSKPNAKQKRGKESLAKRGLSPRSNVLTGAAPRNPLQKQERTPALAKPAQETIAF